MVHFDGDATRWNIIVLSRSRALAVSMRVFDDLSLPREHTVRQAVETSGSIISYSERNHPPPPHHPNPADLHAVSTGISLHNHYHLIKNRKLTIILIQILRTKPQPPLHLQTP